MYELERNNAQQKVKHLENNYSFLVIKHVAIIWIIVLFFSITNFLNEILKNVVFGVFQVSAIALGRRSTSLQEKVVFQSCSFLLIQYFSFGLACMVENNYFHNYDNWSDFFQILIKSYNLFWVNFKLKSRFLLKINNFLCPKIFLLLHPIALVFTFCFLLFIQFGSL